MEIPSGEQEEAHSPVALQVPIEFVLGEWRGTSQWSLDQTVEAMKESLAATHNVPIKHIALSYNGELLSDATLVKELGPDPEGLTLSVQITIESSPHSKEGPYIMPGSLQVKVGADKGILVSVKKQSGKKPFLGGFRHKVSGVEYHNASAQTTAKKKPGNGVAKYERDAQTVITLNKRQQAHSDAATQMSMTGCFINSREDKILPISGHFETADEYHARLLGHVLVLQTYWRQWLAKRYVAGLRRDKAQREQWEEEEAIRKKKERDDRARREFDRRMNPRTKEDFELLYHALEMWRVDELKTINESTSGAERT